jgi:hypothetical protein
MVPEMALGGLFGFQKLLLFPWPDALVVNEILLRPKLLWRDTMGCDRSRFRWSGDTRSDESQNDADCIQVFIDGFIIRWNQLTEEWE